MTSNWSSESVARHGTTSTKVRPIPLVWLKLNQRSQDSAYIFIGGLHFELSEGDVITIFSQWADLYQPMWIIVDSNAFRYGEVMDVNLPRDKETGKPRVFAFLMYEDQRSTVLAVDNLNGAKVLERTLRVDHVKDYKQKGAVVPR